MKSRGFMLLTAMILIGLLLVSCGQENVDSETGQSEKENSLQSISGKLVDASMNSLVLQGQDGKEYAFSIKDDTEIKAENGLILGRNVIVQFTGNLADTLQADVKVVSALPVTPDDRVEELIADMTMEEKVGQMFFVRCPAGQAEEMISKYHMGGYILFDRDFKGETKDTVKQKIQGYQQKAKIKMLIGVDEEGGTVTRVSRHKAFRGAPFRSPQSLYQEGGFDLIKRDTREKAELLSSLGINVNFAPVCDVSTNAGDYMFQRAFGKDAQQTAEYVRTVVSVMKEANMGSVLKHFPGYGSNADTHTGIAQDNREYEQFISSDFLPFQAGIEAGADCVLVSHNIVACMDPKNPASLSVNVHQILRNELEFDGVMITDDLYMDAIQDYTDSSSAAVLAVEAGNDMLCCTDFEEQIPSVIQAVKNGEIHISRIEESVRRILKWKMNLGLIE